MLNKSLRIKLFYLKHYINKLLYTQDKVLFFYCEWSTTGNPLEHVLNNSVRDLLILMWIMYLFTNPDGANFIIASTWAQNPSVGISTKVDPKVGINQSEASI